jgi:hypothetical protein
MRRDASQSDEVATASDGIAGAIPTEIKFNPRNPSYPPRSEIFTLPTHVELGVAVKEMPRQVWWGIAPPDLTRPNGERS